LKFISWNLVDFDVNNQAKEFEYIDNLILNANQKLINFVDDSFSKYDFSSALSAIMTFMSTTISSLYVSIAKDTLYCDSKNSTRRNQIQTVLYIVGESLLRMLNPVLPFTMDEFNLNMPGDRKANPQYYDYAEIKDINSALDEEFTVVNKFRQDVLKAIEEARNGGVIRSEQEACIYIKVNDNAVKSIVNKFSAKELAKLFVVSSANVVDEVKDGKTYDTCEVKVIHHQGHFCERCWNYEDDAVLQEDGTYLCKRCNEVMEEYK
jgi:isoleucyl-tRNA synthetase